MRKRGRPKKYKTEVERKRALEKAHKKFRLSAKGKENRKDYSILYYSKKKDEIIKYQKKRREKGIAQEWERKNKPAYIKKRRETNLLFKIMSNLRGRTKIYMRSENIKKNNPMRELLGCTPKELKSYIELKWKPGMNWENYSLRGWHIDHIIPLSNAKNEEDLKKLCHYKNLQPLWAKENIQKSNN